MIAYLIGVSGQRLVFTPTVVQHFYRHRQLRWWHREGGGQLFARFDLPDIIVEEASGPRRGDWRTRSSYVPNRRAEQREIIERHRRELHFVGDWHTHAEMVPRPSPQDMRSMADLVARSQHALNGFVLVVVGTQLAPDGLAVSIFDGARQIVLPHTARPTAPASTAFDDRPRHA